MARRVLAALLVAVGLTLGTVGQVAAHSTAKVVIVVGPVGSLTRDYKDVANSYANQLERYGADVHKVYAPHATWSRVKRVSEGANLLIYLGHGNGWPSPYYPWQPYTKDGLGLNPYDGAPNSRVRYWGEYYVRRYIKLAPDAVVFLNHLCYASGNNEPELDSYTPSVRTARRRVDNYASGFLRAGGHVVFAVAYTDHRLLHDLFRSDRRFRSIFNDDPYSGHRTFVRRSRRIDGAYLRFRRYSGHYWYRSMAGHGGQRASSWRANW